MTPFRPRIQGNSANLSGISAAIGVNEAFPDHTIVGEEGNAGAADGEVQWIVDPIDGTVNYFFGIPHFCISIAWRRGSGDDWLGGLIYEPMLDELWAVNVGSTPTLNGQPIAVSGRAELKEAMVTVGFSKTKASMDAGFQRFKTMAYQVRKSRMLGSRSTGSRLSASARVVATTSDTGANSRMSGGLSSTFFSGLSPNGKAPVSIAHAVVPSAYTSVATLAGAPHPICSGAM